MKQLKKNSDIACFKPKCQQISNEKYCDMQYQQQKLDYIQADGLKKARGNKYSGVLIVMNAQSHRFLGQK